MLATLALPALFLAAALPAGAQAPQSAEEVFATMAAKEAERVGEVKDYLMVRTVAGFPAVTYHERMGDGVAAFREVPIDELQRRMNEAQEESMPEGVLNEDLARSYELLGEALRDGLKSEGFPADGMFDPRNLTNPMAAFARAGAEAEPMSDGRAEVMSGLEGMKEFVQRARLVGQDEMDGWRSLHLMADGLEDMKVPGAGSEFVMESVSLWLDAVEYVPLKMVIRGRAQADGEWMPITIEKVDLDYRKFGPLLLPSRQILRLGGMEEAMAAKMEEMEAELDELPASVRAMVENQMKNAMSQFEAEIHIVDVQVDQGLPSPEDLVRLMAGGFGG